MSTQATLCWSCANACGNCSWSDTSFTPVKGWKAEPTIVNADRGEKRDKLLKSYRVIECPEFKSDAQEKEKDLLRLNELDMKHNTLIKHIHKGNLKATMINNVYYVQPEEWERFKRSYRRWQR